MMHRPPPTEIIEGFRNPTRDKYLPEKVIYYCLLNFNYK